MPIATSDVEMRDILTRYRRIAVVGLSEKPYRPSHDVTAYLLRQGYTVYAVNPTIAGQQVLGLKVYRSLAELPEPPEIVDVFRRSQYVGDVAEAAITVGAKVLWTQLGIGDDTAAKRASDAGLVVVQDRCTAMEHTRLRVDRS